MPSTAVAGRERAAKRTTSVDFWLCAIAVVVVALLAVPTWQDHRVRQKVEQCLALASPVQQQVASHYRVLKSWPDHVQVKAIGEFLVSPYCEGFISYDAGSGAFMVNINEAAIANGLPRLQPQLTPSGNPGGEVEWTCTRGDTRPSQLKYLPPSCRGLSG